MSNIDKRALREAAEKALSAGDGNWKTWREAGQKFPEIFTSSGHIVATVNGSFSVVRSDFIAAANPATVLVLLDELEAAEKRFAEVRALAAELHAVEAIHNEAVFITDDHYEQCPPAVQKIIRSLAVMQIPAYHAFLAKVRAQGVEMFADSLLCPDLDDTIREFADELRKGGAA